MTDAGDAQGTGLVTAELIAARLSDLRARIDRVAHPGQEVGIVGVTKTFPAALTERALAGGLTMLGENYAQELVAKAEAAEQAGVHPQWHFIGGLQRNKVKLLAGKVTVWQTVDRPVLLEEIARRSPGDEVFIQVNTTDEPQKSGCQPTEVGRLVDQGRQLGLVVNGLMTLGPTAAIDPRPAFDLLVELADRVEVVHRSMGMSSDFETAVAAGSTMIRIGTLLFGPRSSGP